MDHGAGQEPPSKKAKLENDGVQEGHDHAHPVATVDASGAAIPNGSAPENANGDAHTAGAPSDPNPNDAVPQPPAAGDNNGNNNGAAPPSTNTKEAPTKPEPVKTKAPAQAIPLDTYCTREIRHIDREVSGELKAYYVQNDGQPDSGRYLIGLKNIFSKCLPNMPKTYITRLVFDRRHRSVVIVRNGNKVIGGITYRPFHERRFAEIAFCAIAQTLQVSGFGTRLMNWTKKFARDHDACEYFLTYADNNAVGYFSKQGFTKTLTMPRERWHGYIKDYDGGTLMECFIHPTLPFTDLPGAIAAQRTALESAVQQYTTAHVVQPGLTRWKAGGKGGQIPLGDIPGVKEAGWTEATAAAAVPRCQLVVGGKLQAMTSESLKALQTQLLDQLAAETDLVWPYLNPVPKEEVPDYYDVIKNPIDISTIRKRLEQGGFYVTLDIFVADVLRMFTNSKEYNAQETLFYKSAHKLSIMFQQWVNAAVHYEV